MILNSRSNKVFWVLALIILSVSGILLAAKFKPTNSGPQDGIGKVTRGDLIQRVTIAGTVIPKKRTVVMAPYAGYVKKLYVKTGDHVNQGDPLVTVAQSLQSSEQLYPLRAPFSGTVVQVEKAEGEFAKENDSKEAIARIDDLSALYVQANAAEIERLKMKVGQEAIIKASAILDHSYKGIITELSLAAKEKEQWGHAQVEFPLRIQVTDPDDQLKPGMSTLIDIVAGRKNKVLMLRHEYVHQELETYFVILKSGLKQVIQVGIQNEEVFEILKGLNEGDEVKLVDYTTEPESKD